MADANQDPAQQGQRERALIKARRDRTTNMRLVRNAINWLVTPAFADLNLHQLQERLDRFNASVENVKAINEELADGTDNDDQRDALYDEFAVFEGECMDAVGTMKRRLTELAPPPANGQQVAPDGNVPAVAQPQQQVIQVTMPFRPESIQNTWGSFNGDQMGWYDWKAKFTLAVHDIPEAQMPAKNKLQFLLNALTGEGATTISKFEMVPDNYAQIWAALIDRYEKRYPTACAYLSKFFALPQLDNRATAADLRNMVNTTNELIRQIRSVNYPIEHWGLVIVHALHQRLNKAHRAEWERVRNGNEEPTVDEMTRAVLQIATLAENQGLSYQPLTITVGNERAVASSSYRQPSTGQENQRFACAFCQSQAHRSFLCPDFVTKQLYERKHMVFANRLCVWCLKSGHFKHECYSGKHCTESACHADTKHHASVCPVKDRRGPYDHAATASYRNDSQQSTASNFESNTRSSTGASQLTERRFPSGRGRGRDKRHGDQS